MLAFWDTFLGVLFAVICVLLIIVVLLQKGRGGGLGAAFGGAAASAFGTRTGDVFTWITIVLTALFLLLAIGSTLLLRPEVGRVATPSFQPSEGPLDEPMPIIIECSTQEALIAYTTDGSKPMKKNAQAGKAAVTVKPGQTLKAIAFREKWEDSAVRIVTYEKMKRAPKSKPAASRPAPVRTPPTKTPAATSGPS